MEVNRGTLITGLVTRPINWFPGHTHVDEPDIQSAKINSLNLPKVSPFCPLLLFFFLSKGRSPNTIIQKGKLCQDE